MQRQRRGMASRAWPSFTRRRSTGRRSRWAPPGDSPVSGTTIPIDAVRELFGEASLSSLWRDTAAQFSNGTAVNTGSGLVMDPGPNSYCEIESRVPFNLAGKSITWKWKIDPSTFDFNESYVEISLINDAYDYIADIYLDYALGWRISVSGDGGLFEQFSTTDASEWLYVRVDSDPADPGQITYYHSADARTWTTAGTDTLDPAAITNLRAYAFAVGASWFLLPITTTFPNLTGWSTGGDAALAAGQLVLGGTGGFGSASKTMSFNWDSSELNCEAWPDPGNTGDCVFKMRIFRNSDGEYVEYVVDTAADELRWATSASGGVQASPYNPTSMRFLGMIGSVSSGGYLIFKYSASGNWGTWFYGYLGLIANLIGGEPNGFSGVTFSFTSTVATDKWYVDNVNTQR